MQRFLPAVDDSQLAKTGFVLAVGISVQATKSFSFRVTVSSIAASWLLLGGGAARAATCTIPAGAHSVADVAGVHVWSQTVTTPMWARQQYGAGATYPRYSGCTPGHGSQVLFRDYSSDGVVMRVAGDYVGLLDRGGMESLYLSDLLTGHRASSTSFTPSVQDDGGSEANEPGPLRSWTVTPSGWLVYLDTLSDLEGYGTALVAFSESGATTIDLAAPGPSGGPAISGLVVTPKTVSWRSSFSGQHRVRLRRALLPASLPERLPSACQLVSPSLASELLGPLSATAPPAPTGPPNFRPHVRPGRDRSGCAYAAAADTSQTLIVYEQRVTPAVARHQQRGISYVPRADNQLVLPGNTAVLGSKIEFPSSGTEDLRMFVNGIEVDLVTNSDRAARELEAAGLAIERALHDAPGAASHV
jgi:hypothetical protein